MTTQSDECRELFLKYRECGELGSLWEAFAIAWEAGYKTGIAHRDAELVGSFSKAMQNTKETNSTTMQVMWNNFNCGLRKAIEIIRNGKTE